MNKFNNIIFLICFLVALLVWLVISLSSEKTYTVNLPLNYSLSDTHVLLSEVPDNIQVTVRGKTRDLLIFENAMNSNPVNFELSNRKDLDVEKLNAALAPRLDRCALQLIRNHTGNIPVELDSMISKSVAVYPSTELNTSDGYASYDVKIHPAHVTISGPASFVHLVDSVSTSKTVLKNLSADYRDSVHLLKSMSELIHFENDKVVLEVKTSRLVNRTQHFSSKGLGINNCPFDSISLLLSAPAEIDLDASMFDASYAGVAGSEKLSIQSRNQALIKIVDASFIDNQE